MFPALVAPYLLGVITAPLVGVVVKPLVRGTVKTTIGLGLQVRRLATEAVGDLQDVAADLNAAAEVEAPPATGPQTPPVTTPQTPSAPKVQTPPTPKVQTPPVTRGGTRSGTGPRTTA